VVSEQIDLSASVLLSAVPSSPTERRLARIRLWSFRDYALLSGRAQIPLQRVDFEAAPTQRVAVVLDESPHEFSELRWGLIPSWAKDAKIASTLIKCQV
jgi:putative SOS response-associated peptidase YedK